MTQPKLGGHQAVRLYDCEINPSSSINQCFIASTFLSRAPARPFSPCRTYIFFFLLLFLARSRPSRKKRYMCIYSPRDLECGPRRAYWDRGTLFLFPSCASPSQSAFCIFRVILCAGFGLPRFDSNLNAQLYFMGGGDGAVGG